MKLVVLACLVAVAASAPQLVGEFFPAADGRQPIAILKDDRQDDLNGNFRYDFETENGITVNAQGTPGVQGQSNIQGFYRFTFPDGTQAEVRYVADENGYRAESPLVPTPHPLPAHALEQIRVAEEQRQQGITFE